MVVGEERQARNLQDSQWRKPVGAWRHADPRRRRLGAFLLHRLSQPPPGLSEGVCRSSGELGVCRRAVLEGGLTLTLSFRDGPKDQTTDVQLHIGESRDSGFDAEPVIGPRFARTRWHRPGMTRRFFELYFWAAASSCRPFVCAAVRDPCRDRRLAAKPAMPVVV